MTALRFTWPAALIWAHLLGARWIDWALERGLLGAVVLFYVPIAPLVCVLLSVGSCLGLVLVWSSDAPARQRALAALLLLSGPVAFGVIGFPD